MANRYVAVLVIVGALGFVACGAASPAKTSDSTNKGGHGDGKSGAAAANSAVVSAAARVEEKAAPATRKLNQGADAIDRALKGK